MGISTLHPSGFVETGGCSGPRLIRNQPSRETPGVLLNEVTDKYVTQFTVPFRNSTRALKDFQLNWERTSPEERKQILDMVGSVDAGPKGALKGQQSLSSDSNNLHVNNITDLLNSIMNPDDNIKSVYSTDELIKMRSDVDNWVQARVWYYPVIVVILALVIVFIALRPAALGL
jgi:hypothetical protein